MLNFILFIFYIGSLIFFCSGGSWLSFGTIVFYAILQSYCLNHFYYLKIEDLEFRIHQNKKSSFVSIFSSKDGILMTEKDYEAKQKAKDIELKAEIDQLKRNRTYIELIALVITYITAYSLYFWVYNVK